MLDQRPCEEFGSLREILDDPLTALLMQADGVEYAKLHLLLCRLAARRRPLRGWGGRPPLPPERKNTVGMASPISRHPADDSCIQLVHG